MTSTRCPVRTPWTRSTTSSEPASSVIWPAAPPAVRRWRACVRRRPCWPTRRPRPLPLACATPCCSDITRVRPLPPVTAGGPVHRRRWFPALVAAVVLALVGVGGAVWQPWRDDTSTTLTRRRPGAAGPRRRAVHPGAAQRGDGHRRALRRGSTVPSSSPRTCRLRRTGRSTSCGCSRRREDMISAGLMPARRRHRPARGRRRRRRSASACSLEPAGGSDQPTEVVALIDLEAA